MKPNDNDTPHPSPAEADEARVLAVLLGEASPFESEAVEELLSRRPDLREYRDRTAALLGLVADAVKPGDNADAGPGLRLDDSRRAAFLEKLREPAPASLAVSGNPARGRVIRFFRSTIAYAPRYAAAVAVLLVIGFGLSTTVSLVKNAEPADTGRRAEEKRYVVRGELGGPGEAAPVAFEAGADGMTGKDLQPQPANGSGIGIGSGTATKSFKSLFARGAAEDRNVGADEEFKSVTARNRLVASGDAGRNDSLYGRVEGDYVLSNSSTSGLRIRAKADSDAEYVFRGKEREADKDVPAGVTAGFGSGLTSNGFSGGRAAPADGPADLKPAESVPETPAAIADRISPRASAQKVGANFIVTKEIAASVPNGAVNEEAQTRRDSSLIPDGGKLEAAPVAPAQPAAAPAPVESPRSGNFYAADAAKPQAQDASRRSDGPALVAGGKAKAESNAAIDRARARYLSGDYQGALDSYKDVLRNDPYNTEAKSQQIRIRDTLNEKSGRFNGELTKGRLLEDVEGPGATPQAVSKEENSAAALTARDEATKAKLAMETRFIDFEASQFARMVRRTNSLNEPIPDSAEEEFLNDSERALRFFGSLGLDFDKTTGAQLEYSNGRLMVTQTPDNLRRVENILRRYRNVKKMVVTSETRTADNPLSTFSLNVSDVSFRLAAEAAKRGALPDAAGIRTEEFVNAQNYRDASPAPKEDVALRQDQAVHPFAHNRNLLRLSLRTNAEGRASQQPLNLVVLLDNSGSMERSDRRETVAAANLVLSENLRAGDKVSVIGFARDTRMLVDRMDGANTQQLRDLAKNGAPSDGGTNLEKALSTAYSQLASQAPAGTPGRVVLLTDGAANLGDADPARLATMVEKNRARGLALDTFGVGFDGYNDAMLENLSRKGDGRYGYLNSPDDARDQLGQKLAGALRPFANDVKVQVEFNPARVTAWRLLGYDKHRLRAQDFRDNKVDAAELAAAEAGTALYTMELNPEGAGDVGVVRVRYRVPGTDDYREREWTIPYGGAPAFADAPEGVRTAAVAAFAAQLLSNDPDAAVIDAGALVRELAPLIATHPDDRPLADLNTIAVRLSRSGK